MSEICVEFPSFSPAGFCRALAESFKKELVYHYARHKWHCSGALPTLRTLQMTTEAEPGNRGGSVPLGGRQGASSSPFWLVYTEGSVCVIYVNEFSSL